MTAFVRDPQKLPQSVKPTRVVVGDVLNKADVQKAVENQDGVIVVLGTRNDLGPTTALSDGTRNIVEAMTAANVKRVSVCLVCMSSKRISFTKLIFVSKPSCYWTKTKFQKCL